MRNRKKKVKALGPLTRFTCLATKCGNTFLSPSEPKQCPRCRACRAYLKKEETIKP